MTSKLIREFAEGISIVFGFPLSFSLRTLTALVFGNAVGVATALAWAQPPWGEMAAVIWCGAWTAVVLTFAAAREAKRTRHSRTGS